MQVTSLNSWDDVNTALDQLMALHGIASRYDQMIALRKIRNRATDLPPGPDGFEAKKYAIDAMDWALSVVAVEVGQ